jgi:hypothetical protein
MHTICNSETQQAKVSSEAVLVVVAYCMGCCNLPALLGTEGRSSVGY